MKLTEACRILLGLISIFVSVNIVTEAYSVSSHLLRLGHNSGNAFGTLSIAFIFIVLGIIYLISGGKLVSIKTIMFFDKITLVLSLIGLCFLE